MPLLDLVDPVPGHLALGVGGLGQGTSLVRQRYPVSSRVQSRATIWSVWLTTAASTAALPSGVGLADVGLGGQVGPAPLEEGELNTPDLHPQGLLHPVGQQGGQATQLGMAEAVGGGGFGLRDKGAVGVVDAFGRRPPGSCRSPRRPSSHRPGTGPCQKVHLWQVHQVRPGASPGGQASGPGQPVSMAAHDLHDDHGAGVIDPGVLVQPMQEVAMYWRRCRSRGSGPCRTGRCRWSWAPR